MIGPSTPLMKQCYGDTPISCAGGVTVKNKKEMIRAIVEAGGMQGFHSYQTKINVAINKN
jgi:uncharacterized protein (DUF4213/DUF364 family)